MGKGKNNRKAEALLAYGMWVVGVYPKFVAIRKERDEVTANTTRTCSKAIHGTSELKRVERSKQFLSRAGERGPRKTTPCTEIYGGVRTYTPSERSHTQILADSGEVGHKNVE